MTNDTRNGLTFKQWLAKIDEILIRKIGVSHADLSDFNSYDAWDSEMSPSEGAEECMASDDLYCDAIDDCDFD